MSFLINKFIEFLLSYGYKFKHEIQSNNVVIIYLYNLPPELDVKLLELSYNYYNTKEDITKNQISTVRCCMPFENDNEKGVYIVLDEDTYARKINMIDGCVKEYRRKQYDKLIKELKG